MAVRPFEMHRDRLRSYPTQPYPSYQLSDVDQMQAETGPDLVPVNAASRRSYARLLAMDATIYGLPSVFQYVQMYLQAIDPSSPTHTGFDAFFHQRDLSTPEFTAFRTPNVDTLYSNAWLDLTNGPCLVRIPPIGERYYTLQFEDMYANATNLSSRTVGPEGGDFLVATTTWVGDVPPGVSLFRVASPYMWILMRILVEPSSTDLNYVRSLQDQVEITATGEIGSGKFLSTSQASAENDWRSFFEVLDWMIRTGGHPTQEDGYTYRFRTIGMGGPDPLNVDGLDPETQRGMEAGFAEAMAVIRNCRSQVGEPVADTGWVTGTAGEPGFNYLRRAIQNFVGTGGNVLAEKKFFVTFKSGSGRPLDGSKAKYVTRFASPPPVSGHWSLTLYPSATGLLYPNAIDRYAVAATTPGLQLDDGSLTILIQHERPDNPANWLPAPAEEFYIDLRTWEPGPEIRNGAWTPGPVVEASQ